MELFLNDERVEIIEKYFDLYPFDGITTNPKMIGSFGKTDYAKTLKSLRKAVGHKKLFTQVTSPIYEEILEEARYICSVAGVETYIKVPANETGIKAIRTLHERGYKTLGTLCFTTIQAVMALQAGADYVAVLYNYMVKAGYDAAETLSEIAAYIKQSGCNGKMMGVGVRTMEEFGACVACGSDAINLNADNITEWIMNEPSVITTKNFIDGWEATWGAGAKIRDFIK
jgi:TalC/MipB family fructose-6-phosphate aldolase